MYSKFGHHPHPKATFVPNFISVATSVAELAHREKSRPHSINQSLTQPAYFMRQEPKLSL